MRLITLSVLVLALSCKSGPSDTELQSEISGKLGSYPGVTASVKDKTVTLTGTCPDEPCKTSSEATVREIKGVKGIVNNIVINTPPPATAAPEITATDSLTTAVNSLLTAYKTVNATVENGVVTLTGEIKRSQLTALMQSVNELKPKRVVNKLVIK